MRSERHNIANPQPQGASGTWELPGRRIMFWRNWDTSGAGIYDRGEGEGIWRSDQHRIVFSLTPTPPMLLQIGGGMTRNIHQTVGLMSLYPAGSTIRTAGGSSRYAQVCWKPELYQAIAPHLVGLPDLQPALIFPDPLVAQLIRALVDEIGNGTMDRLLADSLVMALAMRVAQRFSTTRSQEEPDLPRPRLRRVLDYIETHLGQDLTLTELASVACLSPSHFSRAFKQEIGTGLRCYTVQRRVQRAREMLLHSSDSLAGIAAATGFADQSHLTVVFRRETGITPGRFRAEAAKTAIPS